jgi:uncharacterized protein (TIRG00374 family)
VKSPPKKALLIAFLFVVGIMVLVLATALLSDFSKLKDAFRHVEPGPFLFALFTTGVAYSASALSFYALFKLVPYPVPFPRFISIMFISDTVNFIISSAGMSSLANRAFLLKQEKVPYSASIPLSLAQNMVFNLVLSCFCLGGLVYLHQHPEFPGGPKQKALLFLMAGLLLFVAGMMAFLLNRAFRRWSLRHSLRAVYWINFLIRRKKTLKRRMAEVRGRVESTLALLRRGWVKLILAFFWVSLNWCFMALTFYYCFRAAGIDLPLGMVLVGFAVMFLSSSVNPVPGGLGVSESLLAYTFKFLGVGFEKPLVAALLFRLVFYLIPLALSMTLYLEVIRSLLKSSPDEGSL